MLYVFHVDTGTMMTFEMNMALQSVAYLKHMVERKCRVLATAQVLLVSGGEVLQNENKVGSYSAGTDTNPIFMFSKAIPEENQRERPPLIMPDSHLEIDFRIDVESCCSLSPSLNTIMACAALANRMMINAGDLTRSCENVIHEQHLQHQGWAAVVANMEDITDEFRDRSDNFDARFKEHLRRKGEYNEFLSRFSDDLEKLSSIPILPALRLNAASNPFTAFDELHADSDTFENQEDVTEQSTVGGEQTKDGDKEGDGAVVISEKISKQRDKEALTLLHWITARENQDSLRQIAEYCTKGLDLLESNTMDVLRQDITNVLENSILVKVKQIRGLEDRLYGLDQLMSETRKIEQEQQDLAQAFVQNQQRATELGDASVIGPLCASHRRQLLAMLHNQGRLTDIRQRIVRAKDELASNLGSRLGWVVYIENKMFELDSKMMFYNRWLARLRRHFSVVEQLHKAPALFVAAVREVVRRRTFSQAFIAWASDLACHLLTIHNEEVMRRREFGTRFSGHFLTGLFPGTEDLPPAFGTQAPRVFDVTLPRLTSRDVATVDDRLPDIADTLPVHDMKHVTSFFVSRSGNQAKVEEKAVKPEEKPIAEEAPVPIIPPSKDATQDRGCESETDTEEFEKVGQSSPSGARKDVSMRGSLRGSANLRDSRGRGSVFYVGDTPPSSPERSPRPTQEELDALKLEVIKCKGILRSGSKQCSESIITLRADLNILKSEATRQKEAMAEEFDTITEKWQECSAAMGLIHREMLQRLTVDHELEMNDIKQLLGAKDEEIQMLKSERIVFQNSCSEKIIELENGKKGLEETVKELRDACKNFEIKLGEADAARLKEIKEIQDRMSHECKAELESLRSRFKWVALTSMDRSPSESSLEKIERPDMIEIANHKQILSQTKEDFEIEREEAIKNALEAQEKELKQKMDEELQALKAKYDANKQVHLNDAVRRIIDEKDRQLEHHREREITLIKESNKYKATIQQLTDPETTDYQSMTVLKARVGSLENEKIHLEAEVKELKEVNAALQERLKAPNVCDISTQLSPATSSATTQLCVEAKSSSTMTEEDPTKRPDPWQNAPVGVVPGLTFVNCGPGNIVLLMWDSYHHNYTVLQESTTLYFVHTDSLAGLDLKLKMKDESKRKLHCIGQVESKEYCYAKKSDNRYRVEKGTRFYQVKVKPPSSMSQSMVVPSRSHQKDRTSEPDMTQSELAMTMSSSIASKFSEASHKHRQMVKSDIVLLREPPTAALPPLTADRVIAEESSPPEASEVPKIRGEDTLDSIESCELNAAARLEQSQEAFAVEERPSSAVTYGASSPAIAPSTATRGNSDEPVLFEERLESELAEEATP